jgi:hypothetical protein
VAQLLPPDQRESSRIVEIHPEGRFLTYGIGTSLMQMRDPAVAKAHVPIT